MATELWHPDIEITDTLACEVISAQFPSLSPINLKCIGEGWDNKAYLVNQQYIFRMPHRTVAAPLIERENAVLKYLQSIINLQIPNPEFAGNPCEIYPYHFHGYPIIPGKSGCHAQLTATSRRGSIPKLALFLKQLHSITEAKAYEIGAETQVFDRTNMAHLIELMRERVAKINTQNIATINMQAFEHELQITKSIRLPDNKVLVHGDMYCRHLMFNQNELTGVIDWGDVGINNPAVDSAIVFSFYPKAWHQSFFDIYGEIDKDTLAYARFLGLYSGITVLLYSHSMGDQLLLIEDQNLVS